MEKEKVSSSDRKARGETQPAENGASATGAGKLSKEPGEHDEKGKDSDEVVTTTTTAAESPLAQLMSRTGYSIVQQNGQRRYGPPPTWTGSPPKRGCEVFVGKIPRDCYEDELVPAFEKAGPIYEMRLMMDYNGQNRGYAFVVYCNALDAKESVKILNNYEIRKGRTLGVCMSVDNCRLFVGGIPKRVNKEEIREEMEKVTEGVVDVIVYPSASDKTKNRGFAFVEYESHRSAAMARRKLMNGRVQLWHHPIAVDWAEPELEVDEEIMSQVKVLYVRNLMLSTTETQIMEEFSRYAPIERVKKIRDYAFVHFQTRVGAIKALEGLNGTSLDGAIIEVTLAKPVDKESQQRSARVQRTIPSVPTAYGFIPVDYSVFPSMYSGYYSASSKYVPRNSMGAKVVKSPRNTKGKPPNFYPVSFGPQIVFPASPVHSPYMSPYMESPKHPQLSEEAVYDVIPGVEMSPAPPHQAPPSHHTTPPNSLPLKHTRNALQILEDLCLKRNWGQPVFQCHLASSNSEGHQLLQYKVYVPALGTTYIPSKFGRSVEESQCIAAEYALIQLGFPLDDPFLPHIGYTPSRHMTPVDTTMAVPYSPHGFVTIQNTPKHTQAPPTWSPDPNMYTSYEPYLPPPFTELYHHHRSF